MNTFFHEGIEFVLPGIFKAYPRDWADQFISQGIIYFTNLKVIRKDEHPERGDPRDGIGVSIRNKTRCTTGYMNPVYVWCSTMETVPRRILDTWKDRDTVLQITDTWELVQRVHRAITPDLRINQFQVGPVTYDKDEGSHRGYHWAEGIFQKGLRHSGQKEFRFALVTESDIDNIVLNMGRCSDIARIAENKCPNQTIGGPRPSLPHG
ncbi:MAG: hypothetical protein KKC51_00470 [Verrucomicrobia bacterium]|nr:hypothetical protein [Verrucomicrobiota bacterium]